MQGLEDHCFRLTRHEFFNGLPAQPVNKWSVGVSKLLLLTILAPRFEVSAND